MSKDEEEVLLGDFDITPFTRLQLYFSDANKANSPDNGYLLSFKGVGNRQV